MLQKLVWNNHNYILGKKSNVYRIVQVMHLAIIMLLRKERLNLYLIYILPLKVVPACKSILVVFTHKLLFLQHRSLTGSW